MSKCKPVFLVQHLFNYYITNYVTLQVHLRYLSYTEHKVKIVIAGAGDIGFHISRLLSNELNDIVLIDYDEDALEHAKSHLDVLTMSGDATSLETLEDAGVSDCDIFLAVTTSESSNLISAIMAKKMGAAKTISRLTKLEYMKPDKQEMFRELGIDKIISPTQLAVQEISRLLNHCEVTDHFEFEDGKLSLVGITIDDDSLLINRSIAQASKYINSLIFRPIAMLRGQNTILPRPDTIFRRKDHVYFITPNNELDELMQSLGKEPVKVKNVMIVGGSAMGLYTARALESTYNVKVIEKDKKRCKVLNEKLNKTLVIKGDASNVELLKEEGLENMDAFIALTGNSETNIITSLFAEEGGVEKTIALVDNTDYTHISMNIGIDTLINKKLIAANNIFRFVRKGKIEAITGISGVNAEIIEFVVHKSNKLTRKPLKTLRFPSNAIIGIVIRGDENIIPTGEFIFEVGDKAIIFALPNAINKIEALFR